MILKWKREEGRHEERGSGQKGSGGGSVQRGRVRQRVREQRESDDMMEAGIDDIEMEERRR